MQSGWKGMGMAQQSAAHIARMNKIYDDQIAAIQARAAAQQKAEEQAALAQQAGGYVGDPLLDENSAIRQHMAKNNLSLEAYQQMSTLQRQREVVDPLLESQWRAEVVENPQIAGMNYKQQQAAKEQFFRQRRSAYGANFADMEEEESGIAGALQDAGGAVVKGVAGLGEALGGIAEMVGGKDNFVASGIKSASASGRGLGNSISTESANQIGEYAMKLASEGKLEELAKLVKDYPQFVPQFIIEQVGGLGGWGAGTKLAVRGIAKGATKVGLDGAKIASSNAVKMATGLPAYSGVQTTGGIAKELSDKGIDPNTLDTFLTATAAGIASGFVTKGMNKLGPGTIENQIASVFRNKGFSVEATNMLTKATYDKLKAGGMLSATKTFGTGLAKNGVKGGLVEGGEEFLQSGLEGTAVGLIDADGQFNHEYEKALGQGLNRAVTGGFLGSIAGGGLGVGRNTLSRYGDMETSANVKQYERIEADVAKGLYKDANGQDRTDMTPDQLQRAKDNEVRLQQEEAARQAEQQATEATNNLYGNYGKTANADRQLSESANKFVAELDSVIADITAAAKANNVANVPVDIHAANSLLNSGSFTDTAARIQEVVKWAKLVGDDNLKQRATEVGLKAVSGYDFALNGKYVRDSVDTDTEMSTGLEKLNGKPVVDLAGELQLASKINTDFNAVIKAYNQATQDGYTKTAEEIAADFNKLVDKHIKNKPAPSVDPAIIANLRQYGNIWGTLGSKFAGGRFNANKFYNDVENQIDTIINNLSVYVPPANATPQTSLTPQEVALLTQKLGQFQTDFAAGPTTATINVDPALLAKVNSLVK